MDCGIKEKRNRTFEKCGNSAGGSVYLSPHDERVMDVPN